MCQLRAPQVRSQPSLNRAISLTDATVGQPYSAFLLARGGTLPYKWKVNRKNGPPVKVQSKHGIVTLVGTPTAAGTYEFTISVTDSSPIPGSASESVSLKVNAATSPTSWSGGIPRAPLTQFNLIPNIAFVLVGNWWRSIATGSSAPKSGVASEAPGIVTSAITTSSSSKN